MMPANEFLDANIKFVQLRVPALLRQARVSFHRLNSVNDVIGVEFFTIGPHNAFAQIDRHLGEVLIVDGALNSQRIYILAGLLVTIPEGLQHQRVVVRGVAAGAPNIKVADRAPTEDLIKDE